MLRQSSVVPALFSLLLVVFPLPVRAAEDLVDGIAAVVNDEVVTFSQVREVVAARERALRSMYQGQELIEKVQEVRLGALNDLIDRQLIIQAFNKEGLQIPPRIIEQQADQIVREEFGGDREAFLRTLQAQGYTLARFKEVEKDKIIVQAMRQRNVRSTTVVSPQKVENYYRNHIDDFGTPEQVKLRMIAIRKTSPDVGGSAETQLALAGEIRTKLVAGADFARMAQMYSEDSTAENGGDWGWIDKKTLNAELTAAVFKLKAGEISAVVTGADTYYILMVEARKNASSRPLSEVRSDIEELLLQEERVAAQKQWIDSLRAKAYIKTF